MNEMGNYLLTIDLGTEKTLKQFKSGLAQACTILNDDTIKCWGDGTFGATGSGSLDHIGDGSGEMGDSLAALNLGTGKTPVFVSGTLYSTCVLCDDDSMKCFGYNGQDHLGYGDTTNRGDEANELGNYLPVVDLGTGRTVVTL